jgi:hypothetical protein
VAARPTLLLAIRAAPTAVPEARALLALSAPFMTASTGRTSGSMTSTTPTLPSLKSMASARIRSFSKPTSTILPTKTPVMPSLQLPPSSPSRTPPTSPALPEAFHLSLFFSYHLPFLVLFFLGSVRGLPLWRALYVESCLYVCFAIFIRAGSTSFRYQMVFAILLEIIIPHL